MARVDPVVHKGHTKPGQAVLDNQQVCREPAQEHDWLLCCDCEELIVQ
jgi:hypothetical protein